MSTTFFVKKQNAFCASIIQINTQLYYIEETHLFERLIIFSQAFILFPAFTIISFFHIINIVNPIRRQFYERNVQKLRLQ